jgi:hypothetical protein
MKTYHVTVNPTDVTEPGSLQFLSRIADQYEPEFIDTDEAGNEIYEVQVADEYADWVERQLDQTDGVVAWNVESKNVAIQAPIYREFYVVDDQGDVPVHFIDQSGETDGYIAKLRLVENLQEIFKTRTFSDGTEQVVTRTLYCEVQHEMEYPYGKYDCEEIAGNSLRDKLAAGRWGEREPRRFCEAALVATPKMALI